MINPTEKDIGRSVVYKQSTSQMEEGVITSFNEEIIFVRYGSNKQSQGTYKRDLEWV